MGMRELLGGNHDELFQSTGTGERDKAGFIRDQTERQAESDSSREGREPARASSGQILGAMRPCSNCYCNFVTVKSYHGSQWFYCQDCGHEWRKEK